MAHSTTVSSTPAPYFLHSMMKTTAAPSRYAQNSPTRSYSDERSAQLCRYPSKLCDNLRSEKRGGGMHRFCAHHRERANINQRRVDHRRRLRRQGLPVPPIERGPMSITATPSSPLEFTVKQEHTERLGDQYTTSVMDFDLVDASDTALPLLPDFSDNDLQELMHVLDQIDTVPGFTIKEEGEEHGN